MKCLDFHRENRQAYQSGELDCLVLHVLCCVFKQEFQNNMREVTDFGLKLLGSDAKMFTLIANIEKKNYMALKEVNALFI